MHAEMLPGQPDFVFEAARIAIFVDGCFWHGCPECYRRPHSNQDYWDHKVETNKQRDRQQTGFLRDEGWLVLRVWEHEVAGDLQKVCRRILRELERRRHTCA